MGVDEAKTLQFTEGIVEPRIGAISDGEVFEDAALEDAADRLRPIASC